MGAVEWKELGDVCEIIKGCSLSKNDVGTGECPVILYGELYTTYGDYITSIKSSVSSELAENATPLKYNDLVLPVSSTTKEAQIGKSSVIKVTNNVSLGSDAIILRNSPNSDFLMYYINSQLFEKEKMQCVNGTTIMHLSPKKMSEKKIPMPSAEEQIRIVGILDTFTTLISNLESELDMRRKQYEHYRNQLLDFEGMEGVEWKKIGSITRVFSASRVHKNEWTNEGVPFWRSSDLISFFNNVENPKGKAFISYELYGKLSAKSGKISKNDILVTGGGTIGIPYIVPDDNPLYVKDADLLCIVHNDAFVSKYLYQYMLCSSFRNYLSSLSNNATIAHYTITQINDTIIPLPSLKTQQEIVSQLDAFENLIQSLEQEIKLRKQQYEYYREKLLTFE